MEVRVFLALDAWVTVGNHIDITLHLDNKLVLWCDSINHKVVVAVGTIFVCLGVKVVHILAEAPVALFAHEHHFHALFEWMVRALFCVTLFMDFGKENNKKKQLMIREKRMTQWEDHKPVDNQTNDGSTVHELILVRSRYVCT